MQLTNMNFVNSTCVPNVEVLLDGFPNRLEGVAPVEGFPNRFVGAEDVVLELNEKEFVGFAPNRLDEGLDVEGAVDGLPNRFVEGFVPKPKLGG